MKPLFRKGQKFNLLTEQVTVKQVYKAGSGYATSGMNFYLIDSSDIGEDTISEYNLWALVKEDNTVN